MNPLVALYFASETGTEQDGQVIVCKVKKEDILFFNSDKAMMLACLPVFSDQKQNEIKRFCKENQGEINEEKAKTCRDFHRFLHEIRGEYPAFECEIIGKDLLKNYFVRAYKDNERIKIQNGLFMIFGLNDKEADYDERICYRINIRANAKQQILKELKLMGISTSTIYPGLERRAMELARKKQIG